MQMSIYHHDSNADEMVKSDQLDSQLRISSNLEKSYQTPYVTFLVGALSYGITVPFTIHIPKNL
jgi:hypothetical protein